MYLIAQLKTTTNHQPEFDMEYRKKKERKSNFTDHHGKIAGIHQIVG